MSESEKTSRPFESEELERIQELMRTQGARVVCPRCEEALVMAGPIAGVGTTRRYYEVKCRSCQLDAVITEAPGIG